MIKKLRYVGADDDQVRWGGNDDPRGILEIGEVYEVIDVDVHTYHTKIYLKNFPNLAFNSVHFNEVIENG